MNDVCYTSITYLHEMSLIKYIWMSNGLVLMCALARVHFTYRIAETPTGTKGIFHSVTIEVVIMTFLFLVILMFLIIVIIIFIIIIMHVYFVSINQLQY